MRWLYEAIDKHWNIFTDDIEIRVMKEYSILARKIVKYYSSEYRKLGMEHFLLLYR